MPYLPRVLRSLRLLARAFFQTLRARIARGPARPGWPFGFQFVLRYLRLDWEETASWDLTRLRLDMDSRPFPGGHVRRARCRDEQLGGLSTRVYGPKSPPRQGAVLFFHGGSFVYGSARTTHADTLARIAIEAGVEVFGPDYRLAPEHTYPAQLQDALAAFDALLARGIPAAKVVLAGDSAGGNLAIEAAIALRDRGGPRPGALVLLSPWSDLTMPGASFQENLPYDFGTRAELVNHAAAFVGSIPLDDPRVSPVYARLDDLPPTFITAGTCEIPRDDILRLADRLEAASVPVTRHLAREMPHNAAFFADMHPEGLATLRAIVAFLQGHLAA